MSATATTDRESALVDLATHGYCVIADALSAPEVDALRERLAAIGEAEIADGTDYVYDDGSNQRIFTLLNKGELFASMAQHPLALDFARHVLGPDLLLSNLDANIAGPGGKRMYLHCDQMVYPPPWTEPLVLNVAWMLTDFTPENGATRVVPGSHRCEHPSDAPGEHESVPVCGPAGSAMVFEGRLWHQTGDNTTANERRFGLFTYYCKPYLRQQENFLVSTRPEVLEAASPVLRTLLGSEPYLSLGSVGGLDRDEPRF